MEFLNKNTIRLDKVLNKLDKFVLDFVSVLNKLGVKYVLISGYIPILFGRSRSSEDIDMFMEKLGFEKFLSLWKALYTDFECLNTENCKEAYEEYLANNIAIRFSRKNKFIPNVEMKFPKMDIDFWSLTHRNKVIINKKELSISPLELQISFKLYLGSEKDLEDAKYMYNMFKKNLDSGLLDEFNRKLNITKIFNKYLR